jgi:hypothetical protein
MKSKTDQTEGKQIKAEQSETSRTQYDQICKEIIKGNSLVAILFLNGIFNLDMPRDASVVWLDSETVSLEGSPQHADFTAKIGNKIFLWAQNLVIITNVELLSKCLLFEIKFTKRHFAISATWG